MSSYFERSSGAGKKMGGPKVGVVRWNLHRAGWCLHGIGSTLRSEEEEKLWNRMQGWLYLRNVPFSISTASGWEGPWWYRRAWPPTSWPSCVMKGLNKKWPRHRACSIFYEFSLLWQDFSPQTKESPQLTEEVIQHCLIRSLTSMQPWQNLSHLLGNHSSVSIRIPRHPTYLWERS